MLLCWIVTNMTNHTNSYYICMQNTTTQWRRATVFLKNILSHTTLSIKGCVWEGVGDQTELQHIDPHSIGHKHVTFPFSWAAQQGVLGPTLLCSGFLYRILSPTCLVSKLTDFLSSPIYIIVPPPPSSCGRHNLALIQPVHGQDYNILIIPRPDVPVIYIRAFPILTAWPGYRSIYNTYTKQNCLKWNCFWTLNWIVWNRTLLI